MAKIKQFRTLEDGILLLQKEAERKVLTIEGILGGLSSKGRPTIEGIEAELTRIPKERRNAVILP